MANAFADALKDSVVRLVFRGEPFTPDTTLYLALFTDDPGGDGLGPGVELSGSGYARQAITFGAPTPAGVIANDTDVFFPVATADWTAAAWVAIFNDVAAGDFRARGQLTTPRTVLEGSMARLAAGLGIVTIA